MCRCLAGLCAGVLLLAACGCTLDSFLLPQSVVYGPKQVVPGSVAEVLAKLQDGLSADMMLGVRRVGSGYRIASVWKSHLSFCLHLSEKRVDGRAQTLVRMQWDRGGDEELWQLVLKILNAPAADTAKQSTASEK